MPVIARILILGLASLLLAGCVTTGPASVKGGECRVFERPQYAVKGLRPYDQDWIDGNIEAGIGGCGWKRPVARPASLDPAPGPRAKAPVKKRSFIKRVKDSVVAPFTKVDPVIETPQPPPVVVTAPSPSAPERPVPPRDPVDELLHPSKDQNRFN